MFRKSTALRQSIVMEINTKFSNIDEKIDELETKFDTFESDLSGFKAVWKWLKVAFATISGIIVL